MSSRDKEKAVVSAATPTTAKVGNQCHPISASILSENSGGFKMIERNIYIQKITELIERCNDVPLLDLIYKLLCRSI